MEGAPLTDRPPCPACHKPVHQLRRSVGVFIAYPCNHWLTPGQAVTVAKAVHAARQVTA